MENMDILEHFLNFLDFFFEILKILMFLDSVYIGFMEITYIIEQVLVTPPEPSPRGGGLPGSAGVS